MISLKPLGKQLILFKKVNLKFFEINILQNTTNFFHLDNSQTKLHDIEYPIVIYHYPTDPEFPDEETLF